LNNDELNRVRNNDVTVFQEEIQNTVLTTLNEEYITNIHLNTLKTWRNNFLTSITIPKMRTLFNLTPDANLREFLNNNIINNNRYLYNFGGKKIFKKFDNSYIMEMKMEMEMNKNKEMTPFEEMINNNDPVFKEMERKKNVENKKKLFEDIRMDMEEEDAMDPSLFVKQPIDEQLKNMTPDDFIKLFNDEFSYQDDIVKTVEKQIKDIQENNIKVEMKTGGKSKSKSKSNSNKKTKSNNTRKSKK
jgi:hypothetical protein